MSAGWLAQINSQYVSSSVCRAKCYAELTVSSPVVAKTIASTQCTHPVATEGWLGWVGPDKYWDGRPTNPSTNPAQSSLT